MKRFLSILLALALALTLGIPALAAEHQVGRSLPKGPARNCVPSYMPLPRLLSAAPAETQLTPSSV